MRPPPAGTRALVRLEQRGKPAGQELGRLPFGGLRIEPVWRNKGLGMMAGVPLPAHAQPSLSRSSYILNCLTMPLSSAARCCREPALAFTLVPFSAILEEAVPTPEMS